MSFILMYMARFATSLAALLATAAVAADIGYAQDAGSPEIIVESERPQEEAALADLAREIAGNPTNRRPLARFEAPMCLLVAASDTTFARAAAQRIIDNAKAAGAPTRGKGCTPNALVLFTADARSQLSAIRRTNSQLFAGMSPRELDAALAARDPAYVFQASNEKAASGQDFNRPQPDSPAENRVTSMSRLGRPVRKDLLSALVVIDAGAIAGMTTEQVADYASLRLLAPTAEVDARAAGAPRTIMSLFLGPAEAPAALTRFDRAYLKALYAAPAGSFAAEVLRAAVLAARAPAPDDQGSTAQDD